MGQGASNRALLRSLAWLAVVFAVIFTLNGVGFALRSAHVGAGDKGAAQKNSAAQRREAKTGREASLIARDLKLDNSFKETTPTVLPDAKSAGGKARGRAQGSQRPDKKVVAPRRDSASEAAPELSGVKPSKGKGRSKESGPVALAAPVVAPDSSETRVVYFEGYRRYSGWTTGNLGKKYSEGDDVPYRLIIENTGTLDAASPDIIVGLDHLDHDSIMFDSTDTWGYALSATPPVRGDSDTPPPGFTPLAPSAKDVGVQGVSPEIVTTIPSGSFVIPAGMYATVYFRGHLAMTSKWMPLVGLSGASGYPGSSGHGYLEMGVGARTIPLPVAEVSGPGEVTKTFEMTYPNLPEGASLWVRYSIGEGPGELIQLLPMGDALYSAAVEHIPAGSTIRGEWQLKMGDSTETLGRFCEVLLEDKTNVFSHVGQVCGSKYEDLNGNGQRDEGEPGIGGWTITLLRKVWVVCDVGRWEPYATVVTGADGSYCFSGLPPGLYKVEEEERAGWMQTDAPEESEFAICEDTSITGLDFGNLELPDVTVLKFEDVNGNGVRDSLPGGELEPVLSGWTFTLARGGQTIAEKTTGEDGLAVFSDLELGTYVIDEVVQAGWKAVTSLPLTIQLTTSGADVTLPVANQRVTTTPEVDLGIVKAANPKTVAPGGMVTYRLTYFNLGETPAEDFTIVDDYDESLVAEVVNAGGGVVDSENGTITWTFDGPLSKADGPRSVVYTVKVRADIDEDTFLDNVAVIEVADDVDLSNNKAEARVEVVVEPLLPFTPEEEEEEQEPFLPFTGAELGSLFVLAGLAAAGGTALRRIGKEAPKS